MRTMTLSVLALAELAGCGGAISSRPPAERVAYPDGRARFEFELRDGIPNGKGKAWHRNGALASEGTYKDGARHGPFTFYSEEGTFVAQALYVDNLELWRSANKLEQPPAEHLAALARSEPSEAMLVDTESEWNDDRTAPRPYFSTLDRTTGPARAGAQVGVGTAGELGFGAATRLDVYGHYRIDRYGLFAQISETRLSVSDDMTLVGRLVSTLAGTYHRTLDFATLSATGGLIVPLGNVDPAGSVASYAGAEQRPSDAAFAMPAPLTLRSAASLTATRGRLLVQADAGLDLPLGADQHAVDALGRANVGIGFGTRSTMLTAELDNTLRLSDARTFHAFALGGTVALPVLWISASFAFSFTGTTSFLGSVGRDL
ncbi:MAG: hypothetical protein H0T89_36275 [Deltaproteobacteria bacterium]|nr:hypothetical protein [Deltaproteobacteria bacterium]MDQ3298265.1 hypothetical protein [Myxococcota bacterium]